MKPSKRVTRGTPVRPDPDAVQRKRDRNRASEIRAKIRNGQPTTDEQRAFLAAYDATNENARGPAPSIPRGSIEPSLETAAQPAEGSPPSVGSEPAPGAPAASPDPLPDAVPFVPPPPQPPPAPPRALDVPPPPPSVSSAMGGDWRAKYGGGNGDELSRENVCLKGAELWQGALIRLHAEIIESGGEPLFDPREASFARALVLACDDIIPPHVRISPKTHAVAVTSAIVVQRAIRGKALKEKREAKEAQTRAADRMHSAPKPPPPPIDVRIDGEGSNGRAAPEHDAATTVREPDASSSSRVREPDSRLPGSDNPFAGKPFS